VFNSCHFRGSFLSTHSVCIVFPSLPVFLAICLDLSPLISLRRRSQGYTYIDCVCVCFDFTFCIQKGFAVRYSSSGEWLGSGGAVGRPGQQSRRGEKVNILNLKTFLCSDNE